MNISFLGTGLMGQPLATRLLQAGHSVTVWNRSIQKTRELAAAGAEVTDNPAQAIAAGELVFTMLSDAAALREVLLSEPARSQLQGRSIIQMATIGPQQSRELATELHALGAEYLEAPVLGSTPEARNGTLLIMAGGPEALYNRLAPLLQVLGSPRRVGEIGQAAALKLALNQLIAGLTTSFALSLGFVREQGVPVDSFMDILRQSALYAPTFDKKLDRMLDRDYSNPNFPTRHLLKDVRLFMDESAGLPLDPAALDGMRRILERAISQGLADGDYSALYDAVHQEDKDRD